MQVRSRDGFESGGNLCLGARTRTRDVEMIVGTIKPCFDLRPEEVNRTRGRKPQNKRYGDEACIKVPAPDRTISGPASCQTHASVGIDIRGSVNSAPETPSWR